MNKLFVLLMLYVATLVKHDMLLAHGRQDELLVDAHAFIELAIHLFVDSLHELHGFLLALVILCWNYSVSNRLVVGHANLVELL